MSFFRRSNMLGAASRCRYRLCSRATIGGVGCRCQTDAACGPVAFSDLSVLALQQDDRLGGGALSTPERAQALGRGRLQPDGLGSYAERLTDRATHLVA